MSEKKIAASTPWRRTGCSVISVTRSGRRHDSSIPTPSRSVRYSGSDRPAWRMNHTGVCGTSCLRAARTRADAAVARRTASPGVPVGAVPWAGAEVEVWGVVTTRHPPTSRPTVPDAGRRAVEGLERGDRGTAHGEGDPDLLDRAAVARRGGTAPRSP